LLHINLTVHVKCIVGDEFDLTFLTSKKLTTRGYQGSKAASFNRYGDFITKIIIAEKY